MESNLTFMKSYTYDEKRYFSNAEFNGLFCQSLTTGKIEFLGAFPEEELLQRLIHRTVIGCKNKIFFLPFYGNYISKYDIYTQEFGSYRVGNNSLYCFVSALLIGENILLIPSNAHEKIIVFDYIRELIVNEISMAGKYSADTDNIDLHGAVSYMDNLYIALHDTNVILQINTRTFTVIEKKIGTEFRIRNINVIDDELWCTLLNKDAVLRINIEEWKQYVYDLPVELGEQKMLCVIKWKDRIYCLPGMCAYIMIFNELSDCFEKIDTNLPKESTIDVLDYTVDDDLILYSQIGNGANIKMDSPWKITIEHNYASKTNLNLNFIGLEDIRKKWVKKTIKDNIHKNGFISESFSLSLTEYLNNIIYN